MATRDKISGCIIGLAVGDALGAPHEFRSQRTNVYTGTLYIEALFQFQYAQWRNAVGQYTDDTEMSLALIRSLIAEGKYSRESALQNYMTWANSARAIGRNTRQLLKGVKTIKGFNARWNKKFSDPDVVAKTQSNGSLMRCAVLAFIGDDAIIADCTLTNPSIINIDCSRAYCRAIIMAAQGFSKPVIIESIFSLNLHPDVAWVIRYVVDGGLRDVTGETKGWVLHALHCAFYAWYWHSSYREAIDAVIRLGGDTDTNAAIAGALVGAQLGYTAMMSEPITRRNIEIVRALDITQCINPRPASCSLADFDQLVDALAKLTGIKNKQ